MRMTLLGTGNAPGVPVHGCNCKICTMSRANMDYRRKPCSALLETPEGRYLIDAGLADLAERFPDDKLDGIILTHFHPDHVMGLFHLRWGVGKPVPVYCPPDAVGCADLFTHPGILQFRPQDKFSGFRLGALKVTPLPLIHSKPTLGYSFQYDGNHIAYLTDTAGLPPKTMAWLRDNRPDMLVLDASYPIMDTTPRNHNDIGMAIEIHNALLPEKTIITHIGHDLDCWLLQNADGLPENVLMGKDNLLLSFQT